MTRQASGFALDVGRRVSVVLVGHPRPDAVIRQLEENREPCLSQTRVSDSDETQVELPEDVSIRPQEHPKPHYDVGYRLHQRDDGSFVYGFEIVQETHDGQLGSGATALNFEGTYQDAETHLRNILSEKIECLPEEWESDRFRNRKATDESALTNGWLVRRIFGYWPQFHDAEILTVALYRRAAVTGTRTDLELSIHHWGQDDPDWKEQSPHCKLTFCLKA